MNRQRTLRSFDSSHRTQRVRPVRAIRPRPRRERGPATAPADAAAIALLSDILVGDTAWTLAEVERLISMRELVELGRGRVAGLDDEGASGR